MYWWLLMWQKTSILGSVLLVLLYAFQSYVAINILSRLFLFFFSCCKAFKMVVNLNSFSILSDTKAVSWLLINDCHNCSNSYTQRSYPSAFLLLLNVNPNFDADLKPKVAIISSSIFRVPLSHGQWELIQGSVNWRNRYCYQFHMVMCRFILWVRHCIVSMYYVVIGRKSSTLAQLVQILSEAYV